MDAGHPAATPSAALMAAMITPPSVTDANDRRKLVSKKRERIQASATSSTKAIAAAINAVPRGMPGMRKGSVWKDAARTSRAP